MPHFTSKQRLKIALGGFLTLVGFSIITLTVLTMTKTLDVESVLQPSLLLSLTTAMGVLDIIAGILLLRSK
ncbi:hypothetical protein DRO59_10345 [Candidatus Bathyarchaeota archaeon]|nr:MAG: hypothetical protein DRO59_10345 [Candidatus Bathyarchaeota archaeon]